MSKWDRNAQARKMNAKRQHAIDKANDREEYIRNRDHLFEEGALTAAEQAAAKATAAPKCNERTYQKISKKEYYSK